MRKHGVRAFLFWRGCYNSGGRWLNGQPRRLLLKDNHHEAENHHGAWNDTCNDFEGTNYRIKTLIWLIIEGIMIILNHIIIINMVLCKDARNLYNNEVYFKKMLVYKFLVNSNNSVLNVIDCFKEKGCLRSNNFC